MSKPLSYECPFCHAAVAVTNEKLGEGVECGECGRSFRATLPSGRLIDGETERDAVATPAPGETPAGGRGPEQTLLSVRPAVFRAHPVRTLIFLLLAAAGLVAIVFGLTGRVVLDAEPTVLLIAGAIMLLGPALFTASSLLKAHATTLTVTDRRTVLEKGLLSKSTSEVDHDSLRNIKCDQSLLERTFGYGDIALSSSGQDEMEIVVNDIPKPQEVLDVIRRYR